MLLISGEVQNFVGIHPTRKDDEGKQGKPALRKGFNKALVDTIGIKTRSLQCFKSSVTSNQT